MCTRSRRKVHLPKKKKGDRKESDVLRLRRHRIDGTVEAMTKDRSTKRKTDSYKQSTSKLSNGRLILIEKWNVTSPHMWCTKSETKQQTQHNSPIKIPIIRPISNVPPAQRPSTRREHCVKLARAGTNFQCCHLLYERGAYASATREKLAPDLATSPRAHPNPPPATLSAPPRLSLTLFSTDASIPYFLRPLCLPCPDAFPSTDIIPLVFPYYCLLRFPPFPSTICAEVFNTYTSFHLIKFFILFE